MQLRILWEGKFVPFKKASLILFICLIGILSACSGESTEEKIHNHFEESVSLEEGFEKQQKEITDLEKQEQKLYGEIIDLGMEDFDKIKDLSQQAIKVIEQRSENIKLEKESIDASKEAFNKTEKLIEKLDDVKVKKKAEKLYKVMNDRFSAYDDLYKAYTKSLGLEKELYTMLQKEEIEQEELTDQITSINESYELVLGANEQFNEDTNNYNELKKDFYKTAEINVGYDDHQTNDK